MRTPSQKSKPRKSQIVQFPAPSQGLISNRNLAVPQQGGAAVMQNWFPTPQGPILRRGMRRHATLPDDMPVKSLFSYAVDGQEKLFAANDVGIWDVTSPLEAYNQAISPGPDEIIGDPDEDEGIGWYSIDPDDIALANTSGDWVVIQFSTAGDSYLIGVNGADPAFIYDGTDFDAAAITFPAGSTLTTADLSYVWAYKTRIYFAEKNSLNVWYLAVDQIGGQLELFPLGGVFSRGGSLIWGQAWSLSSGGDGGLSEQNTFCTTEGEVAVYQGLSPDDAASWSKVGVYNIGKPLGKKAFIRAGGDLVVATSIGFVPMSQAIDKDTAALGLNAVSNPITDDWRDAVNRRGLEGWSAELWGAGSMALVAPPAPDNMQPLVFVSNSDSGAWCTFSQWRPTCFEVHKGRLFMGSVSGAIQECWIGGADESLPYTGSLIPLFDSFGSPGQRKISKISRVVCQSNYAADLQVTATYDWNTTLPPAPDAVLVPVGNEWDNGIWNQSIWSSERGTFIEQKWRSVAGSGYAASIIVQVTSGSAVPLDVEMVQIDLTYETADIVS